VGRVEERRRPFPIYIERLIVSPSNRPRRPKGGVNYSSILPLTSALDGGRWSTPRPGRITPEKDPVPIVREARWAPGPVWTGAENLALSGFDHRTVRPVTSRRKVKKKHTHTHTRIGVGEKKVTRMLLCFEKLQRLTEQSVFPSILLSSSAWKMEPQVPLSKEVT